MWMEKNMYFTLALYIMMHLYTIYYKLLWIIYINVINFSWLQRGVRGTSIMGGGGGGNMVVHNCVQQPARDKERRGP